MKKKFFLLLLLCLSVFGNSRPGLATSLIPADLLDRLETEGWQQVSPGVMQRTREGGSVETLGFGAAGLRFKIEQAQEFLAFLQEENARNPSRETRRAIRAHRAEIRHAQAALKDADRTLQSASEALIAVGIDCVSNYDASAEAFPLSQQGVGARASAYHKSGCNEEGEVYAFAYATAKSADGSTILTEERHDAAAPDVPRIGPNVHARTWATAKGKQACFSRARATVTIYNPAITWEVVDENRTCDGSPDVRRFALDAPANVALPASPVLDPNSAAMVANINSGGHIAELYGTGTPQHGTGTPTYDASVGTPRTIVCTGACSASLPPVPIHANWKPSVDWGLMTVIDYTNRKVYHLQFVPRNADGTVMINSDGTVSAQTVNIEDLDSAGMAEMVRVFEMARAAADPANAIRHALIFRTSQTCNTYRYPATSSNGTATGAGCLPMGSRVFLDSSADCSTVSPVGQKAICYALQKYGAYLSGIGNYPFTLWFESPTAGLPGGSVVDPYPGVGITQNSFDLSNIPWSRLKVAADCQCTM